MYETAPIPPSEVQKFIAAKCPNPRCLGCGKAEYDIVNETNIDGNGLARRVALIGFPFPNYDIFKSKTIDVIVICCVECGTLRHIARKVVMAWLAKQGQLV